MLIIRTFLPADAEIVRQLFARGQMDFAQGTEQEAEVQRYVDHSLLDDLADIPANYLNHPRNSFWVAEIGGQVKGMVGIQQRSTEEAELRRMSVAGDARRQGVGWKLLDTVETFCLDQNYSQIYLATVTHLQPAISMYQKNGYQLTREDKYGQISVQHYLKLWGK